MRFAKEKKATSLAMYFVVGHFDLSLESFQVVTHY
jgi:hypothetical protein